MFLRLAEICSHIDLRTIIRTTPINGYPTKQHRVWVHQERRFEHAEETSILGSRSNCWNGDVLYHRTRYGGRT